VVYNILQTTLRGWGPCAFLATALLFTFSFPLHQVPEFAYCFVVPFLVWGYNCSNKKVLCWSAFTAGWLGWLLTIFYLRHVWFGLPFVAAAYGGLYLGGWLFVAALVVKNAVKKSTLLRLVILLGLSGFWVVLEWIRGWLFSGYPWLPLAASQWERPVLLQILEWTGASGLSFVLIFFNLTISTFIIELCQSLKLRNNGLAPRPLSKYWLEGYLSMIFLIFGVFIFLKNLPQKENQQFVFNVGIVQPDIAPNLKWDQDFFWDNLRVLREESLKLKPFNPDVIIWPESAIPSPLNEDINMCLWTEGLVNEVNVPFLIGALAKEQDNKWYNAIVEVIPEHGLSPVYCAKRKPVPFGEYVPLREWLPFLNKVVPLDFDLTPGLNKDPLKVTINDKQWKIGGLVCYEDIFSWLARESVLRGAQFLLVVTNDAWYHAEGGAYQHAANSVIRAVEVRRPVIRCGNNGWSGWIDEYGNIRYVVINDLNSIYFRGGNVFPIYRDTSWNGKFTFYTQHGDWFVILSGFLIAFAALAMWKKDVA